MCCLDFEVLIERDESEKNVVILRNANNRKSVISQKSCIQLPSFESLVTAIKKYFKLTTNCIQTNSTAVVFTFVLSAISVSLSSFLLLFVLAPCPNKISPMVVS